MSTEIVSFFPDRNRHQNFYQNVMTNEYQNRKEMMYRNRAHGQSRNT